MAVVKTTGGTCPVLDTKCGNDETLDRFRNG